MLEAVFAFRRDHGYSPTVREIQVLTAYGNQSSVHTILARLRDKGMVTWVDGQPRTLVTTARANKAL